MTTATHSRVTVDSPTARQRGITMQRTDTIAVATAVQQTESVEVVLSVRRIRRSATKDVLEDDVGCSCPHRRPTIIESGSGVRVHELSKRADITQVPQPNRSSNSVTTASSSGANAR